MKKSKLILFLFLINISGTFSQNTKKIQIVDDNNEAIPFVHIKLSDNFGLISDVNGCFILNTDIDRDSLIYISHIAFEPQQLTTNNLNDTIHLMPKHHLLNEIIVTTDDVSEILANAFKNVSYDIRKNYNSTRLLAIGDSILYYDETSFKLIKVENEKIRIKTYNTINYNISTKNNFNTKFPFAATLSKNPYWVYNSKSNLSALIKNAYLVSKNRIYYKIKSVTDSTNITMYVNRKNNRLLRFEKSLNPRVIQEDVKIGAANYSYDFEITDDNKIVIKFFKYQSISYYKRDTSVISLKSSFSDILVDKINVRDSISFKTLEELKSYKQKQRIIDASLYFYFKRDELHTEINNNDSTSELSSSIILGNPKFHINSDLKDFKLTIPKQNYYIALYNQATLSYDYYPSNSKINVDVNSVNFNQRVYNMRNKDSFNPYGVLNPQSSVFMGLINTFLNKIQDK
ncbi:MAG: hypothetical protein DRJ01_08475 [Bacteroidetes bacterium]|nr:MAG: hypothetical protein DRJ01_08475 [Bacteroidota bacterium]